VEYEIGYHWRECFGNMKLDIIGGSLGEIWNGLIYKFFLKL
jgi:hypothetical protein